MPDLDDKARTVLRVLWEAEDGAATTTDVKAATGLENYEITYRFDKLEELDLVEQSYDDQAPTTGLPPRQAELTDRAIDEIQQGLIGDVFDAEASTEVSVSREQLHEFHEDIEMLERRVDALTNQQRQLADLEDRIDWFEDEYQEGLLPRLLALYEALDEELNVDATQYIETEG